MNISVTTYSDDNGNDAHGHTRTTDGADHQNQQIGDL